MPSDQAAAASNRGLARRLWDFVSSLRSDGVGRGRATIAEIDAREADLLPLSDGELRSTGLALRHRARSGEPLERLLPEAFALVREASRRSLGLRHYDVQLLAGIVLHGRAVAEMQTGRRKDPHRRLAVVLERLTGRGAQLATANDYLAERDAALVRKPLALLGLTTGLVIGSSSPAERGRAYRADVTYGTVKEFGFDFLPRPPAGRAEPRGASLCRPQHRRQRAEPLQRAPHYLLVDEADAACIDESDTPLVIGTAADGRDETDQAAYRWCAEHTEQFIEGTHYVRTLPARRIELTSADGRSSARYLARWMSTAWE